MNDCNLHTSVCLSQCNNQHWGKVLTSAVITKRLLSLIYNFKPTAVVNFIWVSLGVSEIHCKTKEVFLSWIQCTLLQIYCWVSDERISKISRAFEKVTKKKMRQDNSSIFSSHSAQWPVLLRHPVLIQANSASYPQWDGKWVPAKVRWWGLKAGMVHSACG